MDAVLPRRLVLQSGVALASPFALAGLLPRTGHTAPAASEWADGPLSGALLGWVAVDPDRGATIRIIQLSAATRLGASVATRRMTLDPALASLQRICQHAHKAIQETVARSWDVPPGECVIGSGRITHGKRQQAVSYAVWMDVG